MSSPAARDVLGTVTLVTGAEEFLAERSVSSVVASVRAVDPDADSIEVGVGELGSSGLSELTSPSLFSAVRTVVVRDVQDAPDPTAAVLLAYAAAPAEDAALVLVHAGGQKGKALLDQLRKQRSVRELRCEAPKPWELAQFVSAEARRGGAQIDGDAAAALIDAVGADLRTLAAAVDQLAADVDGQPITVPVVRRYFAGRAEVKGFAVADAAIAGRLGEALEQLRWALTNGVAPVLLTSAFATGLRTLARYVCAPSGLREAELAREAGVPPWKLRTLRAQSRGWDRDGLASAIVAVAKADADVKGAADDAAYSLERMVLSVVAARPVPADA